MNNAQRNLVMVILVLVAPVPGFWTSFHQDKETIGLAAEYAFDRDPIPCSVIPVVLSGAALFMRLGRPNPPDE